MSDNVNAKEGLIIQPASSCVSLNVGLSINDIVCLVTDKHQAAIHEQRKSAKKLLKERNARLEAATEKFMTLCQNAGNEYAEDHLCAEKLLSYLKTFTNMDYTVAETEVSVDENKQEITVQAVIDGPRYSPSLKSREDTIKWSEEIVKAWEEKEAAKQAKNEVLEYLQALDEAAADAPMLAGQLRGEITAAALAQQLTSGSVVLQLAEAVAAKSRKALPAPPAGVVE